MATTGPPPPGRAGRAGGAPIPPTRGAPPPINPPPTPAATPPPLNKPLVTPETADIRLGFRAVRAEITANIPLTEQQSHLTALDAYEFMFDSYGGDPSVMIYAVDNLAKVHADVKGVILEHQVRTYNDLTTSQMEADIRMRESGVATAYGLPLKSEEADYIREAHEHSLKKRAKKVIEDYNQGRLTRAEAIARATNPVSEVTNSELRTMIEQQTDARVRAERLIPASPGGVLNSADMIANLTAMPEFAALPAGVQAAMRDIITARFGPDVRVALEKMDEAKRDEERAKIRQEEWKKLGIHVKRGLKWGKVGGAALLVTFMVAGGGLGLAALSTSAGAGVLGAGVAATVGGAWFGKIVFNGVGEFRKYGEDLARNRQQIEASRLSLLRVDGEDPLRRLEMAQQFAEMAAGIYIDANSGDHLDIQAILDEFQKRVAGGQQLQGMLEKLKTSSAFNFNYATTPAASVAATA